MCLRFVSLDTNLNKKSPWNIIRVKWLFRLQDLKPIIFPQQRKLTGSSAQVSSGVFRCESQEQVPEAGSGRFRRVTVWFVALWNLVRGSHVIVLNTFW